METSLHVKSFNLLERLVTPFNLWPAFKSGIIDENGNILIKADQRNLIDKLAFTKEHLMTLRLKQLRDSLKEQNREVFFRSAIYYYLNEEWKKINIEEMESDEYFTKLGSEIAGISRVIFAEEGSTPTVSIGSGNIAGGGYNGIDDIKVSRRSAERYKRSQRKARPEKARS